ncbi:peptidase inhibitor 16-like [Myxocyprinus asiaticus]|uniref:peptidase inhibitor 16-like n=1 Tax=Myxocyprinus asiaticus TaxID=70543 RepID=UPI00222365C5|nr:peptidase inhibitor 16-like [Myxocyprinus asiaticus]
MHQNAALQCAGLMVIFSLAAGYLTEEQKSTIVNMHNELRSQVHPSAAFMQRVVWDEKLRLEAEAYASKCIWKHNPRLKELSMGENLFASTGPFNATNAMLDWFGEHVDYDYENNVCPEETMCGHYAQMVWAKSNKVGCATYLCNTIKGLSIENSTLLVCNYFPQGNFVGQRPYESGEACSKCPDNLPVCEEKICVAENLFSSEEAVSEDTEHSTVSPEDLLTTKQHTTAPVEPTKVHRRMDESSVEREMAGSEIQKASAPLLLVVWLLAALIL